MVGGGELDDGGVLAHRMLVLLGPQWTWLGRGASVDQDGAVGIGHHPSSRLVVPGAAAQTLTSTGVDNCWARLLEAGVWAGSGHARMTVGLLARSHDGNQVGVRLEDTPGTVVIGLRGHTQHLGHGEAHVTRLIFILGL